MLTDVRVLIAEDEPFIALDLVLAVGDVGGLAVGPAATVAEALALLEAGPVDAAILDVNLADRDVTPVVEALVGLGVPIILQTGVGLPPSLADRFPGLAVRIKPSSAKVLLAQLERMLQVQPAHR